MSGYDFALFCILMFPAVLVLFHALFLDDDPRI